ncbi:uncharacterized protein G2W53_037261 [Senna tora]|uniref:Uncharacterized protein n=1 Tax=Senna tora TaxID=362788 RepID=A0A834SU23_9FABA|nr:uncharacterized protein G2W53_037261 [Senna tora]
MAWGVRHSEWMLGALDPLSAHFIGRCAHDFSVGGDARDNGWYLSRPIPLAPRLVGVWISRACDSSHVCHLFLL